MTEDESETPGDMPTQQDEAREPTELDRAKLLELVDELRDAADGGEVSPSLARKAADAIRRVPDATKIRARLPKRSGRHSDELSEEEVERLHLLNRKLAEAEAWIRQRRDQCLSDYFRTGGIKDRDYVDGLWEDVEVEIKVACVLREDHPDFDEDDDNIVAELRWTSFVGIVDDPVNYNWNEFQFAPEHRLSGDHHCYLFRDLCGHVLRCDWDKILSIGGIWIDVHLIQQRGTRW